jgi:hypothetical protein
MNPQTQQAATPPVLEVSLIRTTLERRGTGKHYLSPVRMVEQFWTRDGKLAAENDPFDENEFALEHIKVSAQKALGFPTRLSAAELCEAVEAALQDLAARRNCEAHSLSQSELDAVAARIDAEVHGTNPTTP